MGGVMLSSINDSCACVYSGCYSSLRYLHTAASIGVSQDEGRHSGFFPYLGVVLDFPSAARAFLVTRRVQRPRSCPSWSRKIFVYTGHGRSRPLLGMI